MEGKCNLIFLYDSGKTFRWRLSPVLLRLLILLAVFFPLLAAASLWLNWKLFTDLRTVQEENRTLHEEVANLSRTVARLSGLERYLAQADPEGLGDLVPLPAPLPTEQPAPAPDKAVSMEVPADEVQNAPHSSPTDSGSGSFVASPDQHEQTDGDTPASSTSSVPLSADTANTTTADTAEQQKTGTVQSQPTASLPPDPSPQRLSEVPTQTLDKGLVRVDDLLARRVGVRSLRVSFNLYNVEQGSPLSGRASFQLALPDGRVWSLEAYGDTTYRISRMKRIVGNATLPKEAADVEGASVIVSVLADDDVIYRVTTSLQQ